MACHYLSGNSSSTGESMAGTNKVFTYDRVNDTFVSDDANGYRYVHDHIWNKA